MPFEYGYKLLLRLKEIGNTSEFHNTPRQISSQFSFAAIHQCPMTNTSRFIEGPTYQQMHHSASWNFYHY